MAPPLSAGRTKQVLITDVTKMRENRVCVAGLDRNCNCIRPVLAHGSLRVDHLYQDGKRIIAPRNVIEYFFSERVRRPPHTEDHIYDPARARLKKVLTEEQMRRVLNKSCFDSVNDIFGKKLIEDKYLKPDTGKRSIGTIRAKVSRINLATQRISFYDAAGKFYPSRKVTDLAFIEYANQCVTRGQGRASAEKLRTRFRNADDVFLRIGLTRPWTKPGGAEGCWLQITGVYSFPDYLGGKEPADLRAPENSYKKALPEKQIPETGKPYSLEAIRKRYPNAYTQWTEEDDRSLIAGFHRGMSIYELARRFGRQPSAIRSRLNRLGIP